MCYQLVELYSSCRCLYYQHAVDRCPRYGRPGHSVTKRTILVDYTCQDHFFIRSFRNVYALASASSAFAGSLSNGDQSAAIPFRGGELRTTAQQPLFARNAGYTELAQNIERLEGSSSASEATQQSDLTKPTEQGATNPSRRVQGPGISKTSASDSQLQNTSQQPVLENDVERTAIQSTATIEYAYKDGNVIPDRSPRTARSKVGTRRRSPVKQPSNTSHKEASSSPTQMLASMSSSNLTEQVSTSESAREAGTLKSLVSNQKSRIQEDRQPLASKGTKSKEVAISRSRGSDADIVWSGIADADDSVPKSSINENRGIAHFQRLKDDGASTTTTQSEDSIKSPDGTTFPEQRRNGVELMVAHLAFDCILQQFWPQLILRSGSIDTAHQQIARLLLSFSFSLQNLAKTLNDNGDSKDSNQRSMTAKAIESHVSAISCALCLIFRSPDLGSDAHQEGFRHLEDLVKESGSLDPWEIPESKVLEDFLFRTDPLRILRENARVLVEQPPPLPMHIRMIDAARSWYESVYSLMTAKDLQPGRRRLFYTCQCGHNLYDDYNEIRPGALDELRLLLRRSSFKVNDSGDLESNKTLGPLPTSSGTTRSSNLSSKIRDIRLPIHWQKQDQSKLGKCTKKTSQAQNEDRHNYVLTCVPFGRLVYKLQQPEVCTIRSDQDFFTLLRVTYQQHRTRAPLSFLRRVKAVNFVQFDFYRTQFADVRSHPALPPDTLGNQYMYDPMPTDILPPIGSNLLVHFLENPTHAGGLLDLFKRIPRKLRDPLSPCPQKGMSVGWGLAFTEGIDPFVFFLCGCVGFLICLLAALAWTIGKGDVQGGFGIGAFLLSFTLFCGGLVHSSLTTKGLSTG